MSLIPNFTFHMWLPSTQALEWDDAKLKVGRDIFMLLPGKGQIKKNKGKQILCSPVGGGGFF